MWELQLRGPPPAAALDAHSRDVPTDGTALREEHSRLRAKVAALRRERTETLEHLQALEAENCQKDQALSEQLAKGKVGNGISGELFDALRLEVEELLGVKRQAQKARERLEELERRVAGQRQDLQPERIPKMEQEVVAAKVNAKAKARRVAELGAAWSQHQQSAKALVLRIQEAEGDFSRSQQRCSRLQEKRARLEQAVRDSIEQLGKLREKHADVERQQEECRQHLENLAGVREEHSRLLDECKEQKAERVNRNLRASSSRGCRRGALAEEREVHPMLFAPGFRPLRAVGADAEARAVRAASLLLWRLRRALVLRGSSGLAFLASADKDGDGRLSMPELVRVLRRLAVPEGDLASVIQLLGLLADGLAPASPSDGVSVLDLVLALPALPPPAPPAREELRDALSQVAWECRLRGIPEREVRRRFADWLDDPGVDLAAKASDLCSELGLQRHAALVLSGGLELQPERVAELMPSWRCAPSALAGTAPPVPGGCGRAGAASGSTPVGGDGAGGLPLQAHLVPGVAAEHLHSQGV